MTTAGRGSCLTRSALLCAAVGAAIGAACTTDVIELVPADAATTLADAATGVDASPPDAPPPACMPLAPAGCTEFCDQQGDPSMGVCVSTCSGLPALCTKDMPTCDPIEPNPNGCMAPTSSCCQSPDRTITLCANQSLSAMSWTCNPP